MAITDYNMFWVGESLTDASVRTLTTKYRAISSDGTTDNVLTVWNDSRTPVRGAASTWDTSLLCREVLVERGDNTNRIEFIVTVQWSNESGTGVDLTLQAKLDEPPEIDFESGEAEVALTRTVDDRPVINTATDPFDPAPSFGEARPVLSYSRNEADFTWPTMQNYVNHINQGEFLGAEPRTVRLSRVRARKIILPEFSYWRVSYVFEYRKAGPSTNVYDVIGSSSGVPVVTPVSDLGGWDQVKQSVGYNQLAADASGNYKSVKIKSTGDGTDVGTPQWLDVTGAYVPPPREASQAIYCRFKTYPEADFSALNITI